LLQADRGLCDRDHSLAFNGWSRVAIPRSAETSVVGSQRHTLLDPKFGSLYPELPAGHWLPAWKAASRRAERLWQEEGPEALIADRLLPDEHFRFKGGQRRSSGWYIAPERLTDPTGVDVGNGDR